MEEAKTFKGKFRNVIEGRSYTRDKIKKLTEVWEFQIIMKIRSNM
jgi:hypothetical protein